MKQGNPAKLPQPQLLLPKITEKINVYLASPLDKINKLLSGVGSEIDCEERQWGMGKGTADIRRIWANLTIFDNL